MKKAAIFIFLGTFSIVQAQFKVGSNTKQIGNNNFFEVESLVGNKVVITKDSAKMGLGVISPTNLLHLNAPQNPLRIEGLSKGDSTEGVLTVNDSGIIRKVSSLNVGAAYEPWFNVATNRGATLNTQNIYQMGRVGIGNSSPSSPLVVQGVTGNGVLKLIAPSVAAGDNWWMGFGHGTTSTDANDRVRIGVDILGGGSGRLFFTTGAAGSQTRAMFIDENQRVGIGTNAPTSKLEVNGAATNNASIITSNATIDFSLSNLAATTNTATSITLSNIKNGGAYTLAFTSTAASGVVTFTASGFTFVYIGTVARTAGKKHIYNFVVIGTEVFVTMGIEN